MGVDEKAVFDACFDGTRQACVEFERLISVNDRQLPRRLLAGQVPESFVQSFVARAVFEVAGVHSVGLEDLPPVADGLSKKTRLIDVVGYDDQHQPVLNLELKRMKLGTRKQLGDLVVLRKKTGAIGIAVGLLRVPDQAMLDKRLSRNLEKLDGLIEHHATCLIPSKAEWRKKKSKVSYPYYGVIAASVVSAHA